MDFPNYLDGDDEDHFDRLVAEAAAKRKAGPRPNGGQAPEAVALTEAPVTFTPKPFVYRDPRTFRVANSFTAATTFGAFSARW